MRKRTYKIKPTIKAGDKYNRLTAIKFDHRDKNNNLYWLFRCSCGNEKVIQVNHVKSGDTKSCGCLSREPRESIGKTFAKENKIHRMTHTKEYNSWLAMKQRCLNKKNNDYKYYGVKGIKVCKRWLKFENFYKDMGKRPVGTSLDRINNNLGYYKKNCKWSTAKEQANNRTSNRLLTFNGKTQNITQWANNLGIRSGLLYSRIDKLGWDIEKALTTKKRKIRRNIITI